MAQNYTYQNASACSSFITLCQASLSFMSEINLWIDVQVQVQVTAEINVIEFILLCLNVQNKHLLVQSNTAVFYSVGTCFSGSRSHQAISVIRFLPYF